MVGIAPLGLLLDLLEYFLHMRGQLGHDAQPDFLFFVFQFYRESGKGIYMLLGLAGSVLHNETKLLKF